MPPVTSALAPLFDLAKWGVGALLLSSLLNTVFSAPSVLGWLGERKVRTIARRGLPAGTYTAFHNLTLPTPDGTTQIDHVFVSAQGVFVVETKHMRGWIFGSERQAQWTQKRYRKTYRFQNPLRQNYKHLKALEAALGIKADQLHSVVVFTGAATFKTPMPANVTRANTFVAYIKSFQAPVFTPAQVGALTQALSQHRLAPTRATQRAHVARLKQRNCPDAPRNCPRCGKAMLQRRRKAGGAFWGCSGFPQCRARQAA